MGEAPYSLFAQGESTMNTIHESRSRLRAMLSLWLFVVALLMAAGGAWADELPIVLSNQNIGMSGSEIEASQPSVDPPAPPPSNPAPQKAETSESTSQPTSEFVSADPSDEPKSSNPGPSEVTTYPVCVERAIRGGADYDASAQVCRILFPDSSN